MICTICIIWIERLAERVRFYEPEQKKQKHCGFRFTWSLRFHFFYTKYLHWKCQDCIAGCGRSIGLAGR